VLFGEKLETVAQAACQIYFNIMGAEPVTINRFCKTRGLGEEEKQEHMKN
jgi:hypothetical protein